MNNDYYLYIDNSVVLFYFCRSSSCIDLLKSDSFQIRKMVLMMYELINKKMLVFPKYKIYTILLAFLFSFPLYEAYSQISLDAAQITVRQQEEGAWIDTTYAVIIDSGLTASRRLVDTLEYIHTFQHINMYLITLRTNMEWANAWRDGNLMTGQPEVDSLSNFYKLVEVRSTPGWNYFDLIFEQALNTSIIAQQYGEIPGVTYTGISGYGGDGDDIIHFNKMNRDFFIFSAGWGDCPAGCIFHYYWYLVVDKEDINYTAELK